MLPAPVSPISRLLRPDLPDRHACPGRSAASCFGAASTGPDRRCPAAGCGHCRCGRSCRRDRRVLGRETWLGYDVIGALTPEPGERPTPSGVPLLGSSRSVAEVALEADADVVFLAGGAFSSSTEMRRLAWDLEHEDIAVVIAPSVTDVSRERISVRPVGGLPLIHLEKPRSAEAAAEPSGSSTSSAPSACSCFFARLRLRRLPGVVARRWPDPVPADPRRPRRRASTAQVPHHGHRRRGSCSPSCTTSRVTTAGLFKMENDPRVTAPGQVAAAFLPRRAAAAGERARGDMSLVGPRPPLPTRSRTTTTTPPPAARAPGMTGLWQVSGRSDLAWSEACGSISTTSTTGRWSRTCPSWCARSARSWDRAARTDRPRPAGPGKQAAQQQPPRRRVPGRRR